MLRFLPPLLAVLLLAACSQGQEFVDRLRPEPVTPHDRYARALEDAGLSETALARDWLAAANAALVAPVQVSLPFRERAYFSASEAEAASWTFVAQRGERLRVTLAPEDTAGFRVFADLFQVPDDSSEAPRRRAWADSLALGFVYDVRADGRFILRVQPELLRTGSVTITIETGPSLAFPVQGRDTRAIQSFFGADRDAGRRQHHGVDIFAPRGTPVLAAVDGVIRSTRPNTLGGIVVWLRDEAANQSLYYAHLDTQVVRQGQRVRLGDTLGFVGNSGNARTTPPHLHFGIYVRGEGPVDPLPFIREGRPATRGVIADVPLGTWVRTRAGEAVIFQDPSRIPGPRRMLPRGTPLRVVGASTTLLRVRLPDGSVGYAPPRVLEPTDRALAAERFVAGTPVRTQPAPAAPALGGVPDEPLPVLGRYGGYALVRMDDGKAGWVELD